MVKTFVENKLEKFESVEIIKEKSSKYHPYYNYIPTQGFLIQSYFCWWTKTKFDSIPGELTKMGLREALQYTNTPSTYTKVKNYLIKNFGAKFETAYGTRLFWFETLENAQNASNYLNNLFNT